MNGWMTQLGPMAWPLFFCSVATLSLILERTLFYLGLYRLSSRRIRFYIEMASKGRWRGIEDAVYERRESLLEGIGQLIRMRGQPTGLREDKLALWLSQQRRRLFANIKWLTLLAVISPLLGLLGTVLGMIRAFRDIAAHTGPIHPALLAEGLQQAMLTTAAGLVIAIPALVFVHAFRIWGGAYLETLEHVLSNVNLAMQGVSTEQALVPSSGLSVVQAGEIE